jgi:hypothetical protein
MNLKMHVELNMQPVKLNQAADMMFSHPSYDV